MATEKAVLPVELAGGAAVEQGLSRIDKAFSKIGSAIASNAVPALKSVGGAIGGLFSDGLRAAGVLQTISLANAVEDAKRLDLATAKLGQSAGVLGSTLKSNFDAVEKKTLTSSVVMAEFSRSLGRATYDGKFAADSVAALGEEALAAGRDLGDELPIAVALRGLGVEAKSLPAELGRIRDMAERVGTVGGHMALKDTLAALGPELARVSAQTPEARTKLEALVAVLGKGLKPEQAKAVGAAALSTIRGRALDIERVTGKRVLDDNNELIDPTETLKDLKRLADRKYGKKNTEAKRRALMTEFQPDLGLAIYRTDFSEVDRVKTLATNKEKTEAEADKFRKDKPGARINANLAKDQTMRGAGSWLTGIHDTLTGTLGVPGAMGVELVGGYIALAGAKAAGRQLLAGGVASAGMVPAALGLGAAAVGIGTYYAAGENKQLEARRASDRSDARIQGFDNVEAMKFHRSRMGLELAQPTSEQAAATEALLLKFDQLNATLQGQAQAYAEAMGRKVLKVAMPADPNAPKGN